MSVITDTVLILLGVALLLLVGFAIPFVLQIRQTAKDAALTLRILNEKLPAIMTNLEAITTEVSQTTVTVHGQFEDLALIIKKVKGALFVLVGLEEIIRRKVNLPFVPTMGTLLAVSKGARVFLSHLMSERPKCG
jgi:hypothetical protein